jgi:arylesterase/paraoxonase
VEVFEHSRGSRQLEHIKTVFSDAVLTPNNIAATGDGGFLVSNDHDYKVSMVRIIQLFDQKVLTSIQIRDLAFLTGGGSVAYCGSDSQCHIATSHKSMFANGVAKGHDGLYYVAQSAAGKIYVYSMEPDHSLLKIDEINIGMGVDNLSVDINGDIFVPGFPKPLVILKAVGDPLNVDIPSSIFRIRKESDERGRATYRVTKVLEDIEGKFLPGSTVVVHDAKTDTFFMGGFTSPFITVCKGRS